MTTHDILCARAQACVDHDATTIALCDAAISGSADARAALVRQSAGRRVGRATVIRTGLVAGRMTTTREISFDYAAATARSKLLATAGKLFSRDVPSFGGDEVR